MERKPGMENNCFDKNGGIDYDSIRRICKRSKQMTDELYVVHSFETHFSKYKHKKIVIYGKGPKTKLILDVFPDYNIIGLMDPNVMEGVIHGKRMLTYEEVKAMKADMIVVIGQVPTTAIVYERIAKFCLENHIGLYGINGKNLFDYYGTGIIAPKDSSYFCISEKELKRQIDEHEVISFDIFDTLIMRKTLNPLDVFDIVQDKAKRQGIEIDNFKVLRRKAEMENPQTEVNIYEIYQEFQKLTGISTEEKENLMNLEIETEKQVLIRREKMVEIFRYALDQKKRVFLISDMYLPGTIIGEILTCLGITGYEELMVSCDYRQAKWNTLFFVFKEKVAGRSYLHIGDNDYIDDECARQSGLDTFPIKSAYAMMKMSTYGNIETLLKTVNEKSLVGMCISRIFNNPFALYHSEGRPKLEKVEDLGYVIAAPLLTAFALWLIKQVKEEDYDELLLSARDGFIIQKLYNKARESLKLDSIPKGIYFETSRRACAMAAMETEKDIEWLARVESDYSAERILEDRFGLTTQEIEPYFPNRYNDIVEYIMAHKDKIYEKSRYMRQNFWRYMKKIGLKLGNKYALMDFCAVGTSQYFLEKFAPFTVEGLYLCRYHSDYNMVNSVEAKGMFDNPAFYAVESYFYEHYLFMETILTSFKPSLRGFDEAGNPIYEVEERSKEQIHYLEQMHNEIEKYFNDYMESVYIEEQEISTKVIDRIYNWLSKGYSNETCCELGDLLLIDGLGKRKISIRR